MRSLPVCCTANSPLPPTPAPTLPEAKPASLEARVQLRQPEICSLLPYASLATGGRVDVRSQPRRDMGRAHLQLWKAAVAEAKLSSGQAARERSRLRRLLRFVCGRREHESDLAAAHAHAQARVRGAQAEMEAAQGRAVRAREEYAAGRAEVRWQWEAQRRLDAIYEWIFEGLADRSDDDVSKAKHLAEVLRPACLEGKEETRRLGARVEVLAEADGELRAALPRFKALRALARTHDPATSLEEQDMLELARASAAADAKMEEARGLGVDLTCQPVDFWSGDLWRRAPFQRMRTDNAFREHMRQACDRMSTAAAEIDSKLETAVIEQTFTIDSVEKTRWEAQEAIRSLRELRERIVLKLVS